MPSFHEVRFPDSISKGSSGGPRRRTDIIALRSGYEERNSIWQDSRREYSAGLGLRSLDLMYEALEFWEGRYGNLYGFRWKDWLDFTSTNPLSPPGFQDVALGIFVFGQQIQLFKPYAQYLRKITKPVYDTVKVGMNGIDISDSCLVDYTTGLFLPLLPVPGSAVFTAGFEFDVPVRFDQDNLVVNLEQFNAGAIPALEIIEIRLNTGPASEYLDEVSPEILAIAGVMAISTTLYYSDRVNLSTNIEWEAAL